MASLPKTAGRIPADAYLQSEKLAPTRREYVDGTLYPMAGASRRHNLIAVNLLVALGNALRGSPWIVFGSDMKVRVRAQGVREAFYYPDAAVTVDAADRHPLYLERPLVLFEVLSKETAQTDQREKRFAYWHVRGLRHYVLIEQDRIEATVLTRRRTGWAARSVAGAEAAMELPPVRVSFPLGRLYERALR